MSPVARPLRTRYRRFSEYLVERFGGPVRKLCVDAGFTCPNRDGSISHDGCIYCEPRAYAQHQLRQAPLVQQLRQGIDQGQRRGIQRFIAYFQSFTNTYAPVSELKATYDLVRAFPEIKALAIGTRPDCVDDEVLGLIDEYTRDYEVWLEYGVQSLEDETLLRLNRGHDRQAVLDAVARTRRFPRIKLAAHVILGLPGEGLEAEMRTLKTLAGLGLDGIKFHPLHVVKGTRLAEDHAAGKYSPLTREEFAERVVLALERLDPKTLILRLTADCPPAWLIAPEWLLDKTAVLRAVQQRLEETDTWQGKLFRV